MAAASAVWDRNQSARSVESEDKLFLFGYSCKIFRDNEKSSYIDKGKHLIPWMGDESLMIDRYDVRGYLHDLKPYEPCPNTQYVDPLAEEEKLCDEERYLALRTDLTEEQLYHEEELKRLRAAVASDGAYHEIGFTYDNETFQEPSTVAKVEDPDDDLYETPSGLEVPKGMDVPYNMKIHAIIEKTALFISEHGGQMEIIIKMKQQSNPQFAFMHLENPLYPYYKLLVKEIKSGRYKPVIVKKVVKSDDEDDGHYLHPSLMSGKAEDVPKFTVPSINFRREDNDSYSVLVRNLQQQITEDAYSNSPKEFYGEPTYYEHTNQNSTEVGQHNAMNLLPPDSGSEKDVEDSPSKQITIPPPDIQPIIDKMAEYVSKNGEDFEVVVKSKNDKRFDFLNSDNKYYAYYVHKRNASMPVRARPAKSLKKKKKSKQAVQTCHPKYVPNNIAEPKHSTCEPPPCDTLYSQDLDLEMPASATVVPSPPHEFHTPSPFQEETSKELPSSEFLNVEEQKAKQSHKTVKGPISFSLKVKEADNANSEKSKKASLLLDDSEEENNEQLLELPQEKIEPVKSRKPSSDSRSTIVSRSSHVDAEETVAKTPAEIAEAKLAEEKIKERLLAGAREKMAAQRKEKQLQLERKRKAALFLKMLEKKRKVDSSENAQNKADPTPPMSPKVKIPGLGFSPDTKTETDADFFLQINIPGLDVSSDTLVASSPKNGDLAHNESRSVSSLPHSPAQNSRIQHPCSSPSMSDTTDEELYSVPRIQSTITSNSGDVIHLSKDEKIHSESKEHRERKRKKSIPSKYKRRTPSPIKNSKPDRSKKEKPLPAAYSYVRRSRSRSRSPSRRHRSDPNLPNPKRWFRRRM